MLNKENHRTGWELKYLGEKVWKERKSIAKRWEKIKQKAGENNKFPNCLTFRPSYILQCLAVDTSQLRHQEEQNWDTSIVQRAPSKVRILRKCTHLSKFLLRRGENDHVGPFMDVLEKLLCCFFWIQFGLCRITKNPGANIKWRGKSWCVSFEMTTIELCYGNCVLLEMITRNCDLSTNNPWWKWV